MALDIYVGPLVRYYRGDWETIGQQWARTTGVPLTVIRTGGDPGPPPPVEEALQALAEWQRYLNRELAGHLSEPIAWIEDPTADYATDRPGYDAYGALIVWAAYAEHPELRRPNRSPKEYWEDPAFKASSAEAFRSRYGQLIHEVGVWLPCTFNLTCRAAHLGDGEIGIGSSFALLSQLAELNQQTWRASPSDLELSLQDGVRKNAPLEQTARFGFAVFEKLARYSVEHKVPMKLDC